MDESLLYSSPHPRCGERLLYRQFSGGGGGAIMRGNLLYNNGNLYSARQQNNICYSKLNSEQRISFKLLIVSIVIHSITSPAYIFMTLHCLLTKRLVYHCDGLRIIGRYQTNLILHKKLQHFALMLFCMGQQNASGIWYYTDQKYFHNISLFPCNSSQSSYSTFSHAENTFLKNSQSVL